MFGTFTFVRFEIGSKYTHGDRAAYLIYLGHNILLPLILISIVNIYNTLILVQKSRKLSQLIENQSESMFRLLMLLYHGENKLFQ
jgi:hypothetical protein